MHEVRLRGPRRRRDRAEWANVQRAAKGLLTKDLGLGLRTVYLEVYMVHDITRKPRSCWIARDTVVFPV